MTQQSVIPEIESHWYIVHTYSGQEDRVKRNLELRIESMDVKDKIFRVVVPTEEEIEMKEGKRKSVQRKIFPGYILILMRMDDESWYVVRNTPGVTGFVSSEDERERRPKPVPLEDREVATILNRMEEPTPRIKWGSPPARWCGSPAGRSPSSWAPWTRWTKTRARYAYSCRSSDARRRLNWTSCR